MEGIVGISWGLAEFLSQGGTIDDGSVQGTLSCFILFRFDLNVPLANIWTAFIFVEMYLTPQKNLVLLHLSS